MTRNIKNDKEEKIVSEDEIYIRRELIGKGSFKTVYKAYNEEDGLEVAWNEVPIGKKEQAQKDKITHEVQLLSQLNHPNIIRIHAAWEDKQRGMIVFITELMTSGTLRDFIVNQSTCTVRRKIMRNFCIQILNGLKYLHGKSIIHRDLKCDNIFLNGNKGEVKIGDFGLSITKVKTYVESVIGTPEFMAPELYEEKYTEKVDIYSFGMCVLEMATGEYPYAECENVGQVFRKVTLGIKPRALEKVYDPEIKDFILACLLPADSRPSATQLLDHPFVVTLCLASPYPSCDAVCDITPHSPLTPHSQLQRSRGADVHFKSPFDNPQHEAEPICPTQASAPQRPESASPPPPAVAALTGPEAIPEQHVALPQPIAPAEPPIPVEVPSQSEPPAASVNVVPVSQAVPATDPKEQNVHSASPPSSPATAPEPLRNIWPSAAAAAAAATTDISRRASSPTAAHPLSKPVAETILGAPVPAAPAPASPLPVATMEVIVEVGNGAEEPRPAGEAAGHSPKMAEAPLPTPGPSQPSKPAAKPPPVQQANGKPATPAQLPAAPNQAAAKPSSIPMPEHTAVAVTGGLGVPSENGSALHSPATPTQPVFSPCAATAAPAGVAVAVAPSPSTGTTSAANAQAPPLPTTPPVGTASSPAVPITIPILIPEPPNLVPPTHAAVPAAPATSPAAACSPPPTTSPQAAPSVPAGVAPNGASPVTLAPPTPPISPTPVVTPAVQPSIQPPATVTIPTVPTTVSPPVVTSPLHPASPNGTSPSPPISSPLSPAPALIAPTTAPSANPTPPTTQPAAAPASAIPTPAATTPAAKQASQPPASGVNPSTTQHSPTRVNSLSAAAKPAAGTPPVAAQTQGVRTAGSPPSGVPHSAPTPISVPQGLQSVGTPKQPAQPAAKGGPSASPEPVSHDTSQKDAGKKATGDPGLSPTQPKKPQPSPRTTTSPSSLDSVQLEKISPSRPLTTGSFEVTVQTESPPAPHSHLVRSSTEAVPGKPMDGQGASTVSKIAAKPNARNIDHRGERDAEKALQQWFQNSDKAYQEAQQEAFMEEEKETRERVQKKSEIDQERAKKLLERWASLKKEELREQQEYEREKAELERRLEAIQNQRRELLESKPRDKELAQRCASPASPLAPKPVAKSPTTVPALTASKGSANSRSATVISGPAPSGNRNSPVQTSKPNIRQCQSTPNLQSKLTTQPSVDPTKPRRVPTGSTPAAGTPVTTTTASTTSFAAGATVTPNSTVSPPAALTSVPGPASHPPVNAAAASHRAGPPTTPLAAPAHNASPLSGTGNCAVPMSPLQGTTSGFTKDVEKTARENALRKEEEAQERKKQAMETMNRLEVDLRGNLDRLIDGNRKSSISSVGPAQPAPSIGKPVGVFYK